MTTDRPYFDLEIPELRQLFSKHGHSLLVLGQLRTELELRESRSAKQLLKEVTAVLDGAVRGPQKPEAPWPTEQGDLLLD